MKNGEDIEIKLSPFIKTVFKGGKHVYFQITPNWWEKSTWLYSFEILWIEMSNNNMKMDQYNKCAMWGYDKVYWRYGLEIFLCV